MQESISQLHQAVLSVSLLALSLLQTTTWHMATVKRRCSGETGAPISETCLGFEAVRSETLNVLRRWDWSDINKCHGTHPAVVRLDSETWKTWENPLKTTNVSRKEMALKTGIAEGGWRTAPHLEAQLFRSTVLTIIQKHRLNSTHEPPRPLTNPRSLVPSSRRARTWRRRTPPCGRRWSSWRRRPSTCRRCWAATSPCARAWALRRPSSSSPPTTAATTTSTSQYHTTSTDPSTPLAPQETTDLTGDKYCLWLTVCHKCLFVFFILIFVFLRRS